ncbi:MAG: DNA repair protein RadA [Gemmatimonadaceae bacterium]
MTARRAAGSDAGRKARSVYRCSSCGGEFAKWAGRCESCGEWNTLIEEPAQRGSARRARASTRGDAALGARLPVTPLREVQGVAQSRLRTGLDEMDFVLGGGVVPGAMVLIGGEPGVGKSTLLLQIAARLQRAGSPALYVSGEESPLQIRLRADRLSDDAQDVNVLAETELEHIIAAAAARRPALLIVDSIQTVYTGDLEGAPGNVGQVRECAARLMRFAKESGTAVLVIGHVTKGGGIAGPRTLEHIVDTVLYFEGDGAASADHRVLRATKNRFGSVDEIGVFHMTDHGLVPVANPSELFVGDRLTRASGSALTVVLEGTRPMLVELQALASKSGFATPQRVTAGYDARRLSLLLAVLERRAKLPLGKLDVFVNVAGGLRLAEPAGDLALATALASSVYERVLPADAVCIGEVGLGGEVRGVSQTERRLSEAASLGMRTAYVSARSVPRVPSEGLNVIGVTALADCFEHLFA